MSLNKDIIQSVINGDESMENLVKRISVLELTTELQFLIKTAYEQGRIDESNGVREDWCEL